MVVKWRRGVGGVGGRGRRGSRSWMYMRSRRRWGGRARAPRMRDTVALLLSLLSLLLSAVRGAALL